MEAQKNQADKLEVSGLDSINFAETKLSLVDGETGRLLIGGYDVEQLGRSSTFEEACFLLRHGALPNTRELAEYQATLGHLRVKAFSALSGLHKIPSSGMDYLRSAFSFVESSDSDPKNSEFAIALAAVASSSWNRQRSGCAPIPPDPTLSHAADFLRTTLGNPPDNRFVQALNSYLVTVSDHGMNASTFAARVIASTGSDTFSSITGAIGALKGPLHGGAPGPVLEMLEAIGTPANALPWLENELAAGRRIMGMGHRIYRVRDPRARVLEDALQRLDENGIKSRRLSLARAVESSATELLAKRYPDRQLKANVEFYTAVLLDVIGIPPDLFSPTFAVGRVAGWCAHLAEQRKFGRLIRPKSTFVGITRQRNTEEKL